MDTKRQQGCEGLETLGKMLIMSEMDGRARACKRAGLFALRRMSYLGFH
jgi:hypothetical protein